MAPPNAPLEIDDEKLNALLDEVSSELNPILKAEADRISLAKGDDSPPPKEESESAPQEESEPSGPPSPSPEASAPPAAPPAGPEASASAPPPGAEASAPPGAAPGGMPSDPAQLAAMIAPLPMEQKKMLYMVLKEQLFAAQAPAGPEASAPGMGAPPMAPGAPGAGAPPAPPMPPEASAPPAPGAPPMPPPMGKGEFKSVPANGDDNANPKNVGTGKMSKAELENAELKGLVKSQGEDIANLTKIVKIFVSTPMRKAVTSIATLSKSGEDDEPIRLTKAELTDKLKTHSRNPKLAKTDRDAITKFYDSGSTNVNLIAHLLKQ